MVKGLIRKFEALDPARIAKAALEQKEADLLEYNQAQMYGGEDRKGYDITPEYSPLTVQIKTEKGQPTDRVTLYDTGSFYEKQYLEVQADYLKIYSTDAKTQKIVRKYGADIFGLSVPYKKSFIKEHLRPAFQMEIIKVIGLPFK